MPVKETNIVTDHNTPEHQDQWKLLANAMPQLVWIAEADGTVTYYNDRVFEYSGARKNEQNTWEWSLLLHPDDLVITEQAWTTSLRTGKVYEVEHRVQMADGSFRWHLSRGFPQFNAEGKIEKWFGTATDIHNQILFKEELNRKVEERTAALSQLNEQLRSYNKELEDFAFITSHDLQEPLRKIKLFCSLLMQRASSQLNESENRYLNKIFETAGGMKTILSSLLQYSEFNERDTPVQVNLGEIVNVVLDKHKTIIEKKNALIQVTAQPTIKAVPHQMHELFYNLINNALKFSREDVQPIIYIETYTPQEHDLPKGFISDRAYVAISIKDNGIGFDQEAAEKIFTIFQRFHDRNKYEGTGMGLVLCKKIVHRHGGKIWAEAKVNEGATFKILLPVE